MRRRRLGNAIVLDAGDRSLSSDNQAMLVYLVFDCSETDDGTCSWDALASPGPAHSQRLLEETSALLHTLQARHGPPGPLDEGHAWDFDLQVHDHHDQAWPWSWSSQGLQWACKLMEGTPLTLSLAVCAQATLRDELEGWLHDQPGG